MTSKELGLIEKYVVERTDGKPVRWCFVLEDTDPLAIPALLAYADAAESTGYVSLASDLRVMADRLLHPPLLCAWPAGVTGDGKLIPCCKSWGHDGHCALSE